MALSGDAEPEFFDAAPVSFVVVGVSLESVTRCRNKVAVCAWEVTRSPEQTAHSIDAVADSSEPLTDSLEPTTNSLDPTRRCTIPMPVYDGHAGHSLEPPAVSLSSEPRSFVAATRSVDSATHSEASGPDCPFALLLCAYAERLSRMFVPNHGEPL